MLRFAHPEYLNLLYILPLLAVLYWYASAKRRKRLKSFANLNLQNVLFPRYSTKKRLVKFILEFIVITFSVLALANPQIGSKIEEVKQVGSDVFICLDVSLSMNAQDIKPSRLEKAKYEISKLIQRLRGDRIGLIVFAGNAYVQIPLTTDYAAAQMLLNAVDVNSVPEPGTAIASAIELAIKSFKGKDNTQKTIVVITDGEDHEGDLQPALNEAKKKGILIYTIGLGSPAGVPIPIYNSSGQKIGYKKDSYGNVVLTRLDEATLKEIADATGGKYFRGTNTEDELEKIYNDLAHLKKTEFGATRITDYEDRFYYLLIPAFFILIFEILIPGTKSEILGKFFENNKSL
jgi:Ca-activated chloride channel family protein